MGLFFDLANGPLHFAHRALLLVQGSSVCCNVLAYWSAAFTLLDTMTGIVTRTGGAFLGALRGDFA